MCVYVFITYYLIILLILILLILSLQIFTNYIKLYYFLSYPDLLAMLPIIELIPYILLFG